MNLFSKTTDDVARDALHDALWAYYFEHWRSHGNSMAILLRCLEKMHEEDILLNVDENDTELETGEACPSQDEQRDWEHGEL